MRVLVIEDDADVAGFVVKALREVGHVVDHAATGPDGLFHAVNETYDALIVDRMLPGVPGLTIVETIRSAGRRGAWEAPYADALSRRDELNAQSAAAGSDLTWIVELA